MTDPQINHYLHQFTHLRTDVNRKRWPDLTNHRAPHKPFLLLSVFDLIAQAEITMEIITITPQLCDLFAGYFQRIMPHGARGSIALPFFHMRSSSFWQLMPLPEKEIVVNSSHSINSLTQLQNMVLGARMDQDLFNLLKVSETRDIFRTAVIQTYFDPAVHRSLLEQGEINFQSYIYSQDLIKKVKREEISYDQTPPKDEYVRDQGFRKAVVGIYEHRCAFCGVRMLTTSGHSAVEAAHIIPWHISHNDDPRNGLSLCKLCHWTFDEGLVAVNNRFNIILSGELKAVGNVPGHLITMEHRPIILPEEELFTPFEDSISYHRTKIFKK